METCNFISHVQFQHNLGDKFIFPLQVAAVLDVMGEASAKAQGLKTAITSGAIHVKEFQG